MPLQKVNYAKAPNKLKLFVGGKPADFLFKSDTGIGEFSGVMAKDGKHYQLISSCTFDRKGMRELAEHMHELADILDGEVAA